MRRQAAQILKSTKNHKDTLKPAHTQYKTSILSGCTIYFSRKILATPANVFIFARMATPYIMPTMMSL